MSKQIFFEVAGLVVGKNTKYYTRKSLIGSNIHIEVRSEMNLTHFGSSFETIHDVTASQLEVLARDVFCK